ncbi:MAG: rhodanese-like domain-containing protein [Proteobacteria bacterium]|nr:rhodanese-like domain-containing protein [Pseudomonadota bacterium]
MHDIDAQTALEWVKSGQALLIDVRSAGEFAAGHAPEAVHIPVGSLSPSALPPGEKRKLVLVCASGMRSSAGCGALRPKGFEAYSLKGGMSAWVRAGGATEAAPGAAEAAARQQKLMAGGAVVLGLALTGMVHPGFLILTALAGARLVSLLRPQPLGGCSSGGPGQTSCSTPEARGKGGGCSNCGAR